MSLKQRLLSTARRQPVDRIPTYFRASKVLTRRLMAQFGIDPAGGLDSAEALLAQTGVDFWASGSRGDAWATFLPAYRGPQPQPPHITDASYFYTLGIPVISSGAGEMSFKAPAFVDPPLARVERASDIPAGHLTHRLAHFDFDNMINSRLTCYHFSMRGCATLARRADLLEMVRGCFTDWPQRGSLVPAPRY
jgi:hypothetical protein